MAKFSWQGRTQDGKVQKGVMEANSADAVVMKLRSQEIAPLEGSIQEKKGIDLNMDIPGLEPKVTDKDLIVFTRQFATMIDAGLPLVQCLDLLSAEAENRTFKKTLIGVKESVESGSTFAEALGKYPKVFDNLFVQMVKAGEVGGILDTIMNRLAVAMEKTARLKKQVKGAMVYPAIVIGVSITVVGILLIFVIPTFAKMFAEMGAELPGLTQFFVNISHWLVLKWGWAYILVTTAALIATFMLINSNDKGQFMLHSFYLKIPLIGDLIKKTTVASFTRTLGTLISSGVPIMEGLDIVAAVASNRVVKAEIEKVKAAISEGKTLGEPMRESHVFPHMVVQMINVGEQTGALDTMLTKIADFYEEEVDDSVAAMTAMIEPIMIVFLGGTVGGVVVAMYLPIFSIASTIG